MANMNKVYSRINWVNNTEPAINEDNLNRMDYAIDVLDDRIVEQNTTKMDKLDSYELIKSWVIDEETGIITVTKVNGSQIVFDLNIEKIPVDFSLSEDGILKMTTDDGTQFTANIGAMIPVLSFSDSDEIAVSVSGDGINKTYSFSVKSGSITEDKIQPNYLADIKGEVAKVNNAVEQSSQNANLSKSYAVGGTGIRDGEDSDNAKYYYERAKEVSKVDIMTSDTIGIGKPDNDTISVDEQGTFKANLNKELLDKFSVSIDGELQFDGKEIASNPVDSELSNTSENPVQNKVITEKINSLENSLNGIAFSVVNGILTITYDDGGVE